MQAEFEIAWHGAAWRDDRSSGPAEFSEDSAAEPEAQGELAPLVLVTGKRQRKSVVRDAVAKLLRESGESLTVWEIFERIGARGKYTFAGVHSAVFTLKDLGYVERDEAVQTRLRFGQHRGAYRWNRRVEIRMVRAQDQPQLPSARPTPVKASLPDKAVIGRRGGLKSAETRPRC